MTRYDTRYLDPTEAWHASVDWAGSYSAVCTGPVDADALARAFDALVDRMPLLRTRLERDEHGFLFRSGDPWRPEFRLRDGGEVAYRDEMRRRLDSTRSLARLTLIPDERTSYVVMALHHAIADANTGLAVFGQLWQAYTAVVNGDPLPVASAAGLPSSAERLLIARGAGGAAEWEEAAAVARRTLVDRAGAFTLPATVADRVRLRADTTDRLLASIGGMGMTPHGFVCGVALAMWRDELRPGGDPVRLVCGSTVDLRGWVSPPVSPLAATNFVHGIEVAVVVGANDEPTTIAGRASAGLDSVMTTVEPERVLLEPERLTRPGVDVDCIVSSVGTIPPFRTPAQLTVSDFRGYPSTSVPGVLLHLVSIYEGRLSVDLLSPEGMLTDERRRRLVGRLGRLLRSCADRSSTYPTALAGPN